MHRTEQYIDWVAVSEDAESRQERTFTPDELINAASLVSDIPRDRLLSEDKSKEVVRARWVAMILMRRQDYSTTEIGRYLGGKDHTTAMYGLRKGVALLETDSDFQTMVLDADARLRGGRALVALRQPAELNGDKPTESERPRRKSSRPKRKRSKRTQREIESQRDQALEEANRIRSGRAELKLSITRGERNVGDVIDDPAVRSMMLVDLVRCVPRRGPQPGAQLPANSEKQARRVLLQSGIREDRSIEDLSVIERRSLLATLDRMRINWAVRSA